MARGIGDPGYTIYIHKATRQTLIPTFQKEIDRLVAWCNRQVSQMEDCPTAKVNKMPHVTHYCDQVAIVTIYDPIMLKLESYIGGKQS
jgi:hypothetical protein